MAEVESSPYNQDVEASNPARCLVSSPLFIISRELLIQVNHGGATILIFNCKKPKMRRISE